MKNEGFTGYNASLLPNAKALRKNMTQQEKRLWHNFLKSYPVKFYRQRVIDRFVVDFYCSKAHLVIELDGIQHTTAEGIDRDMERAEILSGYGLSILRFSNLNVDSNFSAVCTAIDKRVQEKHKE